MFLNQAEEKHDLLIHLMWLCIIIIDWPLYESQSHSSPLEWYSKVNLKSRTIVCLKHMKHGETGNDYSIMCMNKDKEKQLTPQQKQSHLLMLKVSLWKIQTMLIFLHLFWNGVKSRNEIGPKLLFCQSRKIKINQRTNIFFFLKKALNSLPIAFQVVLNPFKSESRTCRTWTVT